MRIKTIAIFFALLCAQGFVHAQQFSWANAVSSTVVEPLDLDADNNGFSVVCGKFRDSLNVNVGVDSTIVTNLFGNGFVARFDPMGNVVWRHRVSTGCESVCTGANGDVFYGGSFQGVWDFDPGASVFELNSGQHARGYVCKLNADSEFQWAFKLGGSTTVSVNAIRTDTSGYLYIAGSFSGSQNFNPLGSTLTITTEPSNTMAYVAKYSPDGICQWVSPCKAIVSFTKWAVQIVNDLYVTDDGQCYLAGHFRGNFLDPVTNEEFESRETSFDVFYCSLDNQGNFGFTNVHGSDLEERIEGIAASENGDVYITGYTVYNLYFDEDHFVRVESSEEAFLAKFDSLGDFQWLRPTVTASNTKGADVFFGPEGEVWGLYASKDTVGFIGTGDTTFIYDNAGLNAHIARYSFDGDVIDVESLVDLDQFKNPRAGLVKNDGLWLAGMYKGDIDLNFGTNSYIISEDSLIHGFVSHYDVCDEVAYQINFLDTQVCDGDSVLFLNEYYTTSGVYTERFLQPDGCDSINQLVLDVQPHYTNMKDTLICENATFNYMGQTISGTGDYLFPNQSQFGCDSNLVLHAMYNDVQASFHAGQQYLSSGWSGGSYQWYQCINNSLVEIPGADSQSYQPTENGEYAVRSQVGECIDTSDCYSFTTFGQTQLYRPSLKIYPNPAKDAVLISNPHVYSAYSIYTITGELIQQGNISNSTIWLSLPNGMYVFQAVGERGALHTSRLVIRN